jgi:hypothetical protein
MPDLAERDRGARSDELGAIHVVVDDIRPDRREVRGEGADGDGVVRILDDHDRNARALQLPDGVAVRQRHDRKVEPRGVNPGRQRVQVLLGAAVRTRGKNLHDADPVGGRDGVGNPLERRAGMRVLAEDRRHASRPRRTSSRWIGSSTAPHSYLYDSSPRRKSSRRQPPSMARSMSFATSTTPGERSRASGSTPAL